MASSPEDLSQKQYSVHLQALLNGPAGRPPPGVKSNLENPSNLDAVYIPIVTLCMIISTLSILIRVYTKLFLIRSRAYEDYAIVMAWACHVGFLVASIYCAKVGGGSNMWDIRLKEFFRLLYWVNISGLVYGITVLLIKLSILLQYLRIFLPNRKADMPLFVTIWIMIGTISIFYFVDSIFEIIMCLPRKKIWNPMMKTGHCFNDKAAYLATGIFNVVSDFAILILPMIPIWRLQMRLRKKILILAIFATGACACVTSILRTYYTFEIVRSTNFSFNILIMGLWTWAEVTIGILVACLPVMSKFFHDIYSKICATWSSSPNPNPRSPRKTESPSEKNHTQFNLPSNQQLQMRFAGGRSLEIGTEPSEHTILDESTEIKIVDEESAIPKGFIMEERRSVITEDYLTGRQGLDAGS